MFGIRVTAQDGATRTHPLPGTQVTIGRDASNTIVLEGHGVSTFHCMIEVGAGSVVTLKERGSTNGTWLNGKRVDEPTRLGENDRFYVGPFLLQLTRMAPPPEVRGVDVEMPGTAGPILRSSGPHRKWRDIHARLQSYAEQWDVHDRAPRFLLRGDELRQARRWLGTPPPSVADEVGRQVRELISASIKAGSKRAVIGAAFGVFGVVALGGVVALCVWWWRQPAVGDEPVAQAETGAEASTGATDEEPEEEPERPNPRPRQKDPETPTNDEDAVAANVEGAIVHEVIPTETLLDVAKRYGIEQGELIEDNLLNPDAPLVPGSKLEIRKPKLRPLPQVKVAVDPEPGETWKEIADRFGISVTRLREFNKGMDNLVPGQKIAVYVDTKPYTAKNPDAQIPEFHVDHASKSVGSVTAGRIENGVKMPEDSNYTLVSSLVWGSAYTIQKLREALATFRRDVDYEGHIMISDLSKKGGGQLDPHKSHQAGRDIDIWLPAVRGSYRKKEGAVGAKKWRRPVGPEIDWYATFGLVRALIRTGAVKYVFLDWDRQKFVYDAARNMGATPAELDEWIQYPRSKSSSKGIFRHSAEHFTHIHVRFKCAEWEPDCKDTSAAHGE
ncbi:MAG: penicillin-insensitive murein endopeptidase [Deltaproteobacteria bacterium]|nr:penicillin-insensitive murein endopeptidase [Nannocystaceae bacterium]